MVEVKGLQPEIADKIKDFVQLNGDTQNCKTEHAGPPRELLNKVLADKIFESSEIALKTLEEMNLLFDYLECYGVLDRMWFDFSLARGLDYYTGIIYEAVLIGRCFG